jgi:hypothetical protein
MNIAGCLRGRQSGVHVACVSNTVSTQYTSCRSHAHTTCTHTAPRWLRPYTCTYCFTIRDYLKCADHDDFPPPHDSAVGSGQLSGICVLYIQISRVQSWQPSCRWLSSPVFPPQHGLVGSSLRAGAGRTGQCGEAEARVELAALLHGSLCYVCAFAALCSSGLCAPTLVEAGRMRGEERADCGRSLAMWG